MAPGVDLASVELAWGLLTLPTPFSASTGASGAMTSAYLGSARTRTGFVSARQCAWTSGCRLELRSTEHPPTRLTATNATIQLVVVSATLAMDPLRTVGAPDADARTGPHAALAQPSRKRERLGVHLCVGHLLARIVCRWLRDGLGHHLAPLCRPPRQRVTEEGSERRRRVFPRLHPPPAQHALLHLEDGAGGREQRVACV